MAPPGACDVRGNATISLKPSQNMRLPLNGMVLPSMALTPAFAITLALTASA